MKKFLKKIFRRPAVLLVTLWAKRTYRQGVEAADRRHRMEGRTIYLAANSFRPDRLVTYDRVQFRTEKRVYGVHARLLTMNSLRRGCYYHTAGLNGQGAMSERDIEIRRRAFIRERLRLAGLLVK